MATITGVQYSGIWNLSSQANAKGANTWPKVPGAPTIGTATAGTSSASVTFTAPTDPGVPATITSYTVTSSPGGFTGTGSTSPITVSGLTNGTAYTFTVTATNATGTGPASAASNSVTPVAAGALYAWGYGNFGNLGLGNTTSYSSPKQVGSLTTWIRIAGGKYFSAGVKNDGTLYMWGSNAYGQLGLGNTTVYSSPKQVGALTNWSYIACGHNFYTMGVKTNGTLWAWGLNSSGFLGLNNTTSYSSPMQVGSLTTWKYATAGNGATLAVKTDGTLWAWGSGYYGPLGLGNETDYSSPKQVGALTSWLFVSCVYSSTIAVQSNGTLWTWGQNRRGTLGLNDSVNRSSPVQIGSLTNWSTNVDAIRQKGNAGGAIKTDGTLWMWGDGSYGNLGLGNQTTYSSPMQVGALTNWLSITGSYQQFTAAIKTDGTLWSWGYNYYGQLGLGNTNNYSSPKQVGSSTTWFTVGSNNPALLAIKS